MRVEVYVMTATYLERHKQTLTLNICETEVDTSRVTINVTIAHNVLNTGVDAVDETVRQLFDASMVPLRKGSQQVICGRTT